MSGLLRESFRCWSSGSHGVVRNHEAGIADLLLFSSATEFYLWYLFKFLITEVPPWRGMHKRRVLCHHMIFQQVEYSPFCADTKELK